MCWIEAVSFTVFVDPAAARETPPRQLPNNVITAYTSGSL
jgi:hypothetical protein